MEEKSAQIEEMLRFSVSVRIFYMKSEIPIYLQLRNQIVKGIGKGEFEEGELLPTVRQMAAVLRSHPVTPIRRKRGYKIRKIIKKWASEGTF